MRRVQPTSLLTGAVVGGALALTFGAWLDDDVSVPAAARASGPRDVRSDKPERNEVAHGYRQGRAASAQCETRLRQCRFGSVDLAQRLEVATHDASTRAAANDEHQLQRDALNTMAHSRMRAHIRRDRSTILRGWRRMLGDPDKAERHRERGVRRVANALGLDDEERRVLAESFEEMWEPLAAQANEELAKPNPDFARLGEIVRKSFAGEDLLALSLKGADGRQTLRERLRDRRTELVATLAALSDDPWDDSLAW